MVISTFLHKYIQIDFTQKSRKIKFVCKSEKNFHTAVELNKIVQKISKFAVNT